VLRINCNVTPPEATPPYAAASPAARRSRVQRLAAVVAGGGCTAERRPRRIVRWRSHRHQGLLLPSALLERSFGLFHFAGFQGRICGRNGRA
jgi:hypothetical protein